MRRVSYELLLLSEQFLETLHRLLRRSIQTPELLDIGIVRYRLRSLARRVGVEPAEQRIQRAHAFPEHPERRSEAYRQQHEVQQHHPAEHGSLEVLPLEGRHRHAEFVPVPVPVGEDSHKHARRLGLPFFGDVHLGIVIANRAAGSRILLAHGSHRIAVVGPVSARGELLAAEQTQYQDFGIVLERIVRLVVYLAHHSEIEDHRPYRNQRYEQQRQAQGYSVYQFHMLSPTTGSCSSRHRHYTSGSRPRIIIPRPRTRACSRSRRPPSALSSHRPPRACGAGSSPANTRS